MSEQAGLDASKFDAISFDCYGTLIDWEMGILGALAPLFAKRGLSPERADILRAYSSIEPEIQAGSWQPYRDVLRKTAHRIALQFGFEATEAEAGSLAESLPAWRPFPDTVPVLERLARRHRLAIVSNINDDLFAGSARHLGVTFDVVVTAAQVRAYKPARAHFLELQRRLALPPARILHVAESLFHDIAPASKLGFPTVWVNRRARQMGAAATRAATAKPDLVVPDLQALADRL